MLLELLIVAQLVKICPAFYGTRRFIIILKKPISHLIFCDPFYPLYILPSMPSSSRWAFTFSMSLSILPSFTDPDIKQCTKYEAPDYVIFSILFKNHIHLSSTACTTTYFRYCLSHVCRYLLIAFMDK
jgi:hypothetical protein